MAESEKRLQFLLSLMEIRFYYNPNFYGGK